MPAPSGPASGPQEYSNAPLPPLSWEGEKMFNIYIYDYCFKRGFRKTARELLAEAEIPADSTPPINARQGLLYEWWSVFWVLFQAKSNAQGGTEDAQLYNMHMRERHDANPPTRNNPSIPGAPSAVSTANPQQRPPMPPGAPNGTAPMSGPPFGQPQHPPGGSPMNFAMAGAPGPQVNGVAGSHPPTPAGGPTQGPVPQGPHPGGPQQTGFHPMMQQRQLNGPQPPQQGPSQQQQHRPLTGPNPNMPFQSPTLAASSPNHGSGMPPPQQPSGPQPPMGNLGGPSPLLGRPGGMLPPNGGPPPQGMMMPPQGGPMLQNGTPTQQFQQIPNNGRPPSRTNTPQMQNMMQQSPSMANRQVVTDNTIVADFSRLPPQQVALLKAEVGLDNKDPSQLTIQDKRRILQHHINRSRAPNAAAGPSNPALPTNQPPRGPLQPQQPQQQPQRGKRPSTSPGEEHDTLPRTESSPPERKRPRRSPMENAAGAKSGNLSFPSTPQQGPAIPPPPQGQQGQMNMVHPYHHAPGVTGNLQTGMNMMMAGGRPMGPPGPMQGQMTVNGHIPPPAMMQGQSMQGQPMQGMNPQNPMGHPGHMGMMPNQMGQGYRVPLHQAHNMQQPLNAGSPAGPDPSFNPGGPMQGPPGGPQFHQNRMMGPKPPGGPGGNMMPPPSPANMNKDPKDGKPDGSPAGGGGPPQNQQQGQQNQAPPQSTPTPQIPPTGTPVGQPPQHQGNNGPQPPQNPSGGPASSPMPNNLMGGPGPGPNPMGGLNNPLGLDSTMDSMDMFNTTDFNISNMSFDNIGENGFDFARDFGQWFNPEEAMSLGTEGMK
ncbi:hypothetical protein BKA70DRAFT_469207 [Coprinopsis sp. MPI-PUGE-AT-0042]|nr:hypothetical protein BKA70DRAFT_469207 [Coprinopsis sp. MPI-PUGE-AT-0042]